MNRSPPTCAPAGFPQRAQEPSQAGAFASPVSALRAGSGRARSIEQRTEVAFAETSSPLRLDDLEKIGPITSAEDLQQQFRARPEPLAGARLRLGEFRRWVVPSTQDAPVRACVQALAMRGQSVVDQVVVRVDGVLECDAWNFIARTVP